MDFCFECNKRLTLDEKSLYKKMVNRGSQSFLCIDCLAKKLDVDKAFLLQKIEQFRMQGCTLFI